MNESCIFMQEKNRPECRQNTGRWIKQSINARQTKIFRKSFPRFYELLLLQLESKVRIYDNSVTFVYFIF